MNTFVCLAFLFSNVCIPEDQASYYGVYAHQWPTAPYVGNRIIVTHKNWVEFNVTYPVGSVHYAPVLTDARN